MASSDSEVDLEINYYK